MVAEIDRSRIVDAGLYRRWRPVTHVLGLVAGSATALGVVLILSVIYGLGLLLGWLPESFRISAQFAIWISISTVVFFLLAVIVSLVVFFRGPVHEFRRNVSEVMAGQLAPNFLPKVLTLSTGFETTLKQFAADEARMREMPYLLCRGACHSAQVYRLPFLRRGLLPDPIHRRQNSNFELGKQSFLDSLNDVLAMHIGNALGVDARPDYGEGMWFDDFVTDTSSQKSILDDGGDLPLRYVQATPHSRFISHHIDKDHHLNTQGTFGEMPKAKYLIILCLTNTVRDPIYILPVLRVVEALRDRYGEAADGFLSTLEKRVTQVFSNFVNQEQDDGIPDDILEPYRRNERSIISPFDGAYRLGFDPNKIDYSAMSDRTEARKALFAISRAIADAAPDETKIKMRPGDVLIVNNYYALHRRKEMRYKTLMRTPLLPRRRWLRVYHAFSRPRFE